MKNDVILLITSILWGFAFVAQRAGMQYIEPFYFNAIRFFLGFLVLVPFTLIKNRSKTNLGQSNRSSIIVAIVAGLLLFMAAAFQQVGIVSTTAGKAGFITGLYVVLVPFLSIFWSKRKPGLSSCMGAVLAATGLFFLTINESFTVKKGDLLVLISALFWAVHVIYLGNKSKKVRIFQFAAIQFLTCSILSFLTALLSESLSLFQLESAIIPILYGGIVSVGIAFTLQVYGQRQANPAHAAVILSLESAFAVLGGVLLLSEILTIKAMFGCSLMLTGMILSQLGQKRLMIKEMPVSQ